MVCEKWKENTWDGRITLYINVVRDCFILGFMAPRPSPEDPPYQTLMTLSRWSSVTQAFMWQCICCKIYIYIYIKYIGTAPHTTFLFCIFVSIFYFFGPSWSKFGPGRPPSGSGTTNSIEFRPSFVQFRPIFAIFDQFSIQKSTPENLYFTESLGHFLFYIEKYGPK